MGCREDKRRERERCQGREKGWRRIEEKGMEDRGEERDGGEEMEEDEGWGKVGTKEGMREERCRGGEGKG